MKKAFLWTLVVLFIAGGVVGVLGYRALYSSVVISDSLIQIPTNSSFDDVKSILSDKGLIKNETVFDQLAAKMNYVKSPMRSGQYELKEGWGTYDLIRHLRGGGQKAANLVVNINWTVDRVAGKLAQFVELDSLSIMNALEDESLMAELNFTKETAMAMFIPNTYEVYWNTTGADLLRRMRKESKAFWNEKRLAKAAEWNMTSEDVYNLAAIVERETNQNEEKERMAGVYHNRLRIGMPLQADPTVKFGIGDLGIKRVLFKHLEHKSPYNTYLNKGLPPGPISMASISSIDAVLNGESHNYLYYCRRADDTGLHEFAKSHKQHLVNAAIYHRWYKRNFG